jgi:hypothetical protein
MKHGVLSSSILSSILAASYLLAAGDAGATVPSIGQLALSDYRASATQVGPNTWHYVGTLHIPVALGMVDVPGASVDMTFNPQGMLQTISGTVGFPTLPGTGLMGRLGAMSSTGPSLQIGYDYPAAFNTLDLPLTPSLRYFYFMEQSGASVTWGPVTAQAPGTGATLFALEPFAPTIFFYTDQLLPQSPIQAVSVGVSGANAIPFTPEYTWGVEGRMPGNLTGNLYLGGSVNIPTEIPELDVNVTGDMTVGTKESSFASNAVDWMQWLGINGDVSLQAGLGPVSLDFYLGGATLLYTRGTTPTVAFSGTVDPDQLLGMPFGPKSSMQAAGYLSKNVTASYLDLQGEMVFPGALASQKSFLKQTIDASVHITSAGATLTGTAKFLGTTVDVSGGVYSAGGHPANVFAVFDGSISHSFNAYIGKVKATITASFDTRHTDVELAAKLQFCMKNPFTGHWACDSIGGSASINGNGNLRVCANVPGFGQTCDTLD